MSDMAINGTDISTYGGASLLDYVIGQTPLTNTIFQGVNDSQWVPLFSEYGLRDIYITIIFSGTTLRNAKLSRSQFNAQVYNKSEIYIPDDGFYYRVSCVELGDEELVGIGDNEAQIKARYHFKGIRHGNLSTITTETVSNKAYINCLSTAPWSACRLDVPVLDGESNVTIVHRVDGLAVNTVNFGSLPGTAGTAILDGFNKHVYLGGNWLPNTQWTGTSPYIRLAHGTNELDIHTTGGTAAERTITAYYYPIYL